MKFWEVRSAFREFEDVLVETFSRTEWREPYLRWYLNFKELVNSQNRTILDALVPQALSAAIAVQVPLIFEFDGKTLRRTRCSINPDQSLELLTAIQLHDRFGGAYIEEVLEYGSATVADSK